MSFSLLAGQAPLPGQGNCPASDFKCRELLLSVCAISGTLQGIPQFPVFEVGGRAAGSDGSFSLKRVQLADVRWKSIQ
ncbi:hypothetical protein [Leisingera daeponensis]|uniref:hypothetical protein n=1 Tax=Leisingera daeponensis TaxID=405746 RepID=UPI001C939936|nr:hypothetical protein [Leisingera daeponensis]MBY6055414.1 hypothetical protein [Leisingera daeponensis]